MTLKLNGTNSEAAPAYAGDDADTGLQCGTNELKLVTGGTARATVDSSGRVLIGTTTEGEASADNLTIADGGDCGITIRTGTSSSGRLFFSDGTSGDNEYKGFIQYGHSNNAMLFGTDATERMRLDSSGNLGVGTTSPSSKTHIKGGSLTVEHASPSTGTCQLNINCENNSQVSFSFDDQGHISFGSTATPHNQGSFSEKLRIQNGGGISFNGDTSQANALNDYEEGSFTPTYGSGITSPSYSGTGGHYTKIGNLVTFTIRIRATGTNNSSQLKVAGLPFSSNTNNEGSVSFGYTDNMNAGDGILGHIPENSSEIHIYDFSADFFRGNNGNGASGKTLHVRGFYYTNS